jgi:hypothetical protein
MAIVIIYHQDFVGDRNQSRGVARILQPDGKWQEIEESSLPTVTLEPASPYLFLISGEHGLAHISTLKTQHPRAHIVWTGHQYFEALTALTTFPDMVALPKGSLTPEQQTWLASRTSILLTDGVSHDLSFMTIDKDVQQFNVLHPNAITIEPNETYVGIMIGGDVPATKTSGAAFYTPDEAEKSANAIVAHLQKQVGDKPCSVIITNGPRTGKYNPATGQEYVPSTHIATSDTDDPTSHAFIEGFLAALEAHKMTSQVNLSLNHFRSGEISAYKPMLHTLIQATTQKQPALLYTATDSSSMIAESTIASAQGVQVYTYHTSSTAPSSDTLVKRYYEQGLLCPIDQEPKPRLTDCITPASETIATVIQHMDMCRLKLEPKPVSPPSITALSFGLFPTTPISRTGSRNSLKQEGGTPHSTSTFPK